MPLYCQSLYNHWFIQLFSSLVHTPQIKGQTMDKKMLLGARIKEIRRRQRLSQETLGERAGISAQYISNIERGRENPTLDLLIRLADALKVSLADMCDFESLEDRRKVRAAIQQMLKTGDTERLRLAFKVLKEVLG